MKFLLLMTLLTLPVLAFSQDEEAVEEPVESQPMGKVSDEQAKEMIEKLRKGQQVREDQKKYIEELDEDESK